MKERAKNRHIALLIKVCFIAFLDLLIGSEKLSSQTMELFVNDTLHSTFKDDTASIDQTKTAKKLYLDLQAEGYLSCVLDSSSTRKSDTVSFYFDTGVQYHLNTLQFGEMRYEMNDLASRSAIENQARLLITPYENNGYPFATVNIRPLLSENTLINCIAELSQGPYVTIDSLVIRSEKSFNQTYMEQYLSIAEGAPYSEKRFKAISKLISELPFAKTSQPPQVLFTEKGAQIFVYLEEKQANRFDGIIGFQPDNVTGRVVFTGDVNLSLQNALRRGEQLSLQWRRLQESTQNLSLKTSLPYLFNTKLGTWAGIELYRRDSTFTTTELELSFGFVNGANKNYRAFYQLWSSNALSDVISSVDNVQIDRYGIAVKQFNFNQLQNPSKGFFITASSSIGLKRTDPVESDQASSTSEQYAGTLYFEYWVPLAKRLTTGFKINGGFKADSSIRLNELYRIGGLGSLRGFDEESIFAQNFAIGSFEVKYLLDATSAVFLFYDQGWYERTDEVYFTDQPFGFGAGALIGTSTGSFSISYGLGKEQNNPIELRSGKIHFGYINSF
ncbi:MAG: outer membrane protein assembly factor BamA [Flavobacteriales bacterium]